MAPGQVHVHERASGRIDGAQHIDTEHAPVFTAVSGARHGASPCLPRAGFAARGAASAVGCNVVIPVQRPALACGFIALAPWTSPSRHGGGVRASPAPAAGAGTTP